MRALCALLGLGLLVALAAPGCDMGTPRPVLTGGLMAPAEGAMPGQTLTFTLTVQAPPAGVLTEYEWVALHGSLSATGGAGVGNEVHKLTTTTPSVNWTNRFPAAESGCRTAVAVTATHRNPNFLLSAIPHATAAFVLSVENGGRVTMREFTQFGTESVPTAIHSLHPAWCASADLPATPKPSATATTSSGGLN